MVTVYQFLKEDELDTERVVLALDELAELRARIDAINVRYDERRDEILKPLRASLDELESARSEDVGELRFKAACLEEEIKSDVIAIGGSVKGSRLQAVYSKPRVTWDTKGLDGYATAHPEIERFKRVGDPSVSIREC